MDYGGKDGAPIYAAADGKVTQIFRDDGDHPYGSFMRLLHAHGADTYETLYCHLRGFVAGLVVGDGVKAGQQIGTMNNTGNSSGTHLHFVLKLLGATANGITPYRSDIINPEPFLAP